MTDPNPLTNDQRKHLDFIQAVIARMSSSSATVKGWGLTVSTAAFAFSANESNPFVAFLGIATVIFFGILDAHYLRQERLFRFLYDDARRGRLEVYAMPKDSYKDRSSTWRALRSWSVAGFYAPLMIVGGAALWWASCS